MTDRSLCLDGNTGCACGWPARSVRRAACVVIERDGKVLAVARRGTTDQWGLPGGKVEPGETADVAATREALEEAGVRVRELSPLYTGDDGNCVVETFRASTDDDPAQGDAGSVAWVTWEELEAGPFGGYNAEVRKRLS